MSVAVQTMTLPSPPTKAPLVTTPAADGDQLSELRPMLSFPRRPISSTRGSSGTASSAAPQKNSSTYKRTARTSFIMSARSTGLATACADTKILSRLLDYLYWTDAHALSGASRPIRRVFLDANIKETVFSHYIPGYRTALRAKDKRIWEDSIAMSYADLGLLIASLDTPLHRFPMHALSVLSSDLPTWEQMQTTKRLQMLAQVHSRVVLVLQNLVHSNARPAPSDLDDPTLKLNGAAVQSGLRELTFPAPLSYSESDLEKAKGSINKGRISKSGPPSLSGHTALHSSPSSSVKSLAPKSLKRHSRKWASETGAASSASSISIKPKTDRGSSRLSIFGGNAARPPLPQPSDQPESLRLYSGNWRSSYYGPPPGEDGTLRPPKRRFVSSRYSSNSSLGSSPSPSSRGQAATPKSSSPHDLYAATKRNRAPILRVFIPCATFTDEVVDACEDQLIDCGLWEHMSVGDVVCNFGYVPLIDEAEETQQNQQEKDHRRWLVFTGSQLEIYHPTQPPPISGALSLPSPFYYTHILPAYANPRLRLTLPPFRAAYSLTGLTTKVASPHAPGGYARVKTFAWLASLDAHVAPGSPMSSGWAGEWVLQGEGTPEGKIALQDALRGGQATECEYEIVLEKSGAGKLWLRMLTPAPGATIATATATRILDDTDLRTSPTD